MKISLWENELPRGDVASAGDVPFLEFVAPDPLKATGASMLIFPGGAYSFLSEKSGLAYAEWLAAEGIAAFVVNFRLGSRGYRYPAIMADAQRALWVVSRDARTWQLDSRRIGVIGTSAGGHLASLLLTQAGFGRLGASTDPWLDAALRPALGVLCYAVVSLLDPLAHAATRANFLGEEEGSLALQTEFSTHLHVSPATPPCFLWHTRDDPEVSAQHTAEFSAALARQRIPYELHLYETGPHALGLARGHGLHWTGDCIRWLRSRGF